MIDVVVSSDAERDIEDGGKYYESREAGLGIYFRSSILSDLTSLELTGGTHGKKHNLHRKICKVFPYWIYYRMESNTDLTVVAVIGQRRSDEYVRQKLGAT